MGPPKGGKSATIPLLPELRRALIAQRLACEKTGPTDPVFPNRLGRHRRQRDIYRA